MGTTIDGTSPSWARPEACQKTEFLRLNPARALHAPAADAGRNELVRVCQDLESVFLTYLLKEMRETIPKAGLLSGGRAEEIYTSLADAELAKELAAGGGIGLSRVLLAQLSRSLGTGKNPESAADHGKYTKVEAAKGR